MATLTEMSNTQFLCLETDNLDEDKLRYCFFSLPCIATDLRTLNSRFKKCVKLLFRFASRHNIIQLMHIDVMSGRLAISNPP